MEENNVLEQTNPAEEVMENEEFGEDFFSEEEPAQPQAEQPLQEETEAAPEAPASLKVKYNGQELEVPADELPAYVQKGMNYDHVYGELEQLRAAQRETAQYQQVISQFAAQAGMEPQEYLAALQRQRQEREIAQQVQSGVPEQVARRLYSLEQTERKRKEQEALQRQQYQRHQQFVQLAKEYPGLKEFPPEVVEKINAGETPLNAYRAYELEQLRQKLSIYEKNQENRAKTPGSAAGELPGEEQDEFMSGFSSVL